MTDSGNVYYSQRSMAKKRAGSNAHFVHQEPGFILCIKLDRTLSARMFS
jgi:hypothetical protein